MKKFILLLIAALVTITSDASGLDARQKKLRAGICATLEKAGFIVEGFTEGDIHFSEDSIQYRIIIDDQLISVFERLPYNETVGFTRVNVESCISSVNQNRAVKLTCYDGHCLLNTDIVCRDVTLFNQTYEAVFRELDNARRDIIAIIDSGLGGLDLTGDKSEIYGRACELYDGKEYDKALMILRYLADAGYGPASAKLGEAYRDGQGVIKDEALMAKYYGQAVENGVTECAYPLGKYYFDNKDYQKALEYLTLASANNECDRSAAYYLVGVMNEKGLGTSADSAMAIKNYRKSAEYSDALDCPAREALRRLGVTVEQPAQFVDLSKALLAGLSPEQMYEKGNEYEHGLNNRTVSLPKAYGYYKAAADQNYVKALIKMGEICISEYYPFHDKARSDKYYSKAYKELRKSGIDSGESNYQLGMMFKNGLGVEKNPETAIEYFRTAAEKGYPAANYEMGLFYKDELEYVEAFNCFKKAAEQGIPAAMLEVAKAYATGMGAPRNRDEAVAWYTRCSETNSAYSEEATDALAKYRDSEDNKEK